MTTQMKNVITSYPNLVLAAALVASLTTQASIVDGGARSTQVVDNSAQISGSIWKHNENSNMRVNLKLLNANRVGYGVAGEGSVSSLVRKSDDQHPGSANLRLDDLKFMKIGTESSRGSRAVDPQSGLYVREGNIGGTMVISGLTRGTRGFNGMIAGVPIFGSFGEQDAVHFSWHHNDAIDFSQLNVDHVPSAGQMVYYDGYDAYYAEKGLRFGKYAIHPLNGDDRNTPFLSYDKKGNVFTYNMAFGSLKVTGQIIFQDTDEVHYHTYMVTEHDPVVTTLQDGANMMNWMDNKASFNTILMRSIAIKAAGEVADKYTSKQVQKTDTIHTTVATEGQYSLSVTSDRGVSMKSDVDSEGASEQELRALMSFLILTAYDSFAD